MKSLGEAATDLPWLSPCAHSLVALARSSLASAWLGCRTDPGLVLLAARASGSRKNLVFSPSCSARILSASLRHLRLGHRAGFVDWSQPVCRDAYGACLRQASLAAALAEHVVDCDPQRAWVGGMLAGLGWLTACAAQPSRVQHYLDVCSGKTRLPQNTKGFDPAAVARRLSHRWRLPPWLATIAGNLGLTVELATRLGADARLFQVVQLAVALRMREGAVPYLAVGAELGELLPALRLDMDRVEQIAHAPAVETPAVWQSPASQPLLIDVLELGRGNRRHEDRKRARQLHNDVDRLQESLELRRDEERRRVQTLKLAALAEFAAGAGHEINNPLAVISGQAQYLVRQLDLVDGPADEIDNPLEYLANLKRQLVPSLQKIIGQTQRIHGILTDLMQFARPAAPKTQIVDASNVIREVADALQALADERHVRLECTGPKSHVAIQGDPSHVRASLTALLRNAIEAAPENGWAGVRVECDDGPRTVLIVEDSGPGPGPVAQEHLFDPFFSGRSAGRGRGMGLPTAWRLAIQQDGDVRFDGTHDGITRFSLILPAAPVVSVPAYTNGRNGAAHHSE
jgi:two-component system, NtrC family, sensor kinase